MGYIVLVLLEEEIHCLIVVIDVPLEKFKVHRST